MQHGKKNIVSLITQIKNPSHFGADCNNGPG